MTLAPLRLLRPANPLVRGVLESRLHPLLSRRLLLLAYRGRRSGRTYVIPVGYVEAPDGRLVCVAARPQRKLWWRSFSEVAPCSLVLRGSRVEAEGILAGESERTAALDIYNRGSGRLGRVTRDAAVVVFTLGR